MSSSLTNGINMRKVYPWTLLAVFTCMRVGHFCLLAAIADITGGMNRPVFVPDCLSSCRQVIGAWLGPYGVVVLTGLLALPLAITLVRMMVRLYRTRRWQRSVADVTGAFPRVKRLAARAGVANQVRVIDAAGYHVGATGIMDQFILLSPQAVDLLDDEELLAVLIHEREHLKGHHPLWLLVLASWRDGFGVIPAVRDMTSYLSTGFELAADRRVLKRSRQLGAALGTAIVKMATREETGHSFDFSGATSGDTVLRLEILSGNSDLSRSLPCPGPVAAVVELLVLFSYLMLFPGLCP